MESLTKDELLQYLDRAIALENSIYGQSQIIDEYNAAMEKCKPPAFVKEEVTLVPEPVLNVASDVIGNFVGGVVLVLVAAFLLFVLIYNQNVFLLILFLASGIFGVLYIGISISFHNSWKKEFKEVAEQNRVAIERVNELNQRKEQEYEKALPVWQHSLEEGRAQLNRPLQETTEILNELYSSDYIYPKYRNLPALTSIYEYLVTGRCDELSGPHGAYNLYEDEVRKDTIISKLSDVVANLEKIRGNQYMLYECIRDIQDSTRAAVEELRQIRGYSFAITELTALNAYYNGVTALHHNILAVYRRPRH